VNQAKIEGQTNAGCLLFMSAACSDQHRRDASDITLYTQLAASKKYSRFNDAQRWKQTWIAALTRFGWALKRHESLTLPAAELGTGTLWDWVRQHLPPFFPKALVQDGEIMAKRSIAAHPRQPAVNRLLRHIIEPSSPSAHPSESYEPGLGLQFAFCGAASELYLIVLSFNSRQTLNPLLLNEMLDPKAVVGNVELTYYAVQLNELIYAPLREKISQALESRRADLICGLREVNDGQPK